MIRGTLIGKRQRPGCVVPDLVPESLQSGFWVDFEIGFFEICVKIFELLIFFTSIVNVTLCKCAFHLFVNQFPHLVSQHWEMHCHGVYWGEEICWGMGFVDSQVDFFCVCLFSVCVCVCVLCVCVCVLRAPASRSGP